MISAEVVHGIERSKIDFLRDSLASFDLERQLRVIRGERRDRLAFASGHFQPKPGLTIRAAKIDIPPGQIRDTECRHDWFVSDVLQSLQSQIDLNLRLPSGHEQKKAGKR